MKEQEMKDLSGVDFGSNEAIDEFLWGANKVRNDESTKMLYREAANVLLYLLLSLRNSGELDPSNGTTTYEELCQQVGATLFSIVRPAVSDEPDTKIKVLDRN